MASNYSTLNSSVAQSTRGLFDIPVAVAGVAVTSTLGGLITSQAIASGWYESLEKSVLNPPNVVFGPIWTILYIVMLIAFVVARRGSSTTSRDYKAVFGVNLALNLLWSVVFFGYHSLLGGLMVILLYLPVCIATALVFRNYSKAAAWMIVPLIAWVSFASYLNFAILQLN